VCPIEPGIIVTFEVSAEKLVRDAAQFGWELRALEAQGRLKILSTTRRVFQSEVGFDVHFVKPVSEQLLRDALGAHHTAHR
jgi:KaiC/GvpD/RAD55 family RecA-like ATPase